MGPIYSLPDLLDMLRRRAVVILVIAVLGSLVSLFLAARQQHFYESSEVIQVAQPKIADDLAKSTVEGSTARRMQLIEQRLMARSTVLEIVDTLGLYADLPDLKPSELVSLVRENVSITGVAAVREGFADDGTIAVLTITARMPSPEEAQAVAAEFGRRTIELSVNSRIEQARETLNFFAAKETALAKELAELDDEIASYRTENDVAQPGALEIRQSEIASLNEALLDIAREQIQIRRAADQAMANERPATAQRMLEEFEEQLATLTAQSDLLTRRKAEIEASLETSPEVERQLAAYDRRLQQLQGELDTTRARRNEAEIGFRLETSRQSERLTVLEPAALPDYPVTGGRKRKALLGGAVSVMVALMVAFLLELRKPVLRSAIQMKRETGLMPVVTIPEIKAPGAKRRSGNKGRS
ncbi:DUF874 domain-containing protein [Phaeobacter sp. CAU 1743]|uniref:DUF874 domain-containing protein n=1 Tax=Phaeobacter sp. CAU 1743 TaxID=3140367 RepID=UPI00325B5736